MRKVAPHLRLASNMLISNVWLLEAPDGKRFLVDSGHPFERPALRLALWLAGVKRRGDLAGVLLTHRHSDHAGNAAWLRQAFDCPIICHAADAPMLQGAQPPPPLSRRGYRLHEDLLCRFEDRWPARTRVDEVYAEGPWRDGFRVVPVPGHTDGSVLLHHEPTATLFSGDAILTGIPPLRFFERIRLAQRAFSLDADTCHARVRRFLEVLPPTETVAGGHGPAVARDAHAKLRRLLDPKP
jgi:glyoxylase-like metal-dependent hydrolase (beta-lactamase superfamily II)